jgi:N-acetylglucosaminyl-diphospho-decaprenol L-rhamnosyltransferase
MSISIPFDQPTSLLIIIVNYRTARLTVECLQSLVAEVKTVSGVKVAVVDNDSGDDSVEKIGTAIKSEGWGDWAYLLPSSHNGGYAYGNNFAIRPALESPNPPPYVLLLNPDTQVHAGAIKSLIDFMETHPTAGIAGSSFTNQDGSPWPIAFKFPSLLSELNDGLRLGIVTKLLSKWVVAQTMTQEEQPIDWVPGASMIIRREVFDAIGLMDENYFLYYEETDFCFQAKRAGWECWYAPQSKVMHIAGQSTGVTVRDQRPKRLPQYVFDSRRRYFVKNYGLLYAALTDLIWMDAFLLASIRRIIERKPNTNPPHFFKDFFKNSVLIKGGGTPSSASH